MALKLRTGLLAAAVFTAGCSNDDTSTMVSLTKSLGNRILTSPAEIRAQRALVNAAVVANPDALRDFPSPLLLVTIDDLNLVAVVGPLTDNGSESVWYSADETSLTFRDGYIVASKGLKRDLEGAEFSDVRSERGPTVRDLYTRLGNEKILRDRFYCEITDAGPADANVLGRIYPTQLILEDCRSDEVEFTNAYWVGSVGEFRLSRQWLNPEIGYVAVQKVQD